MPNTSEAVNLQERGSLLQCTGLQGEGDYTQKWYSYTTHSFGGYLLLLSFLSFLSQNHKDLKQNDSSEQFCKHLVLGTFLRWLFPELRSTALPAVQGSAQRRAPRLSFPPGCLSCPTYKAGSQPTVDSSYHQEMQCFKWFNCSCKQITAKSAIIAETVTANQVTLALPLPERGLCYLNLRKVSVAFWTDRLITAMLA